jgi:hypothetical protein
MVLNAQCLPLEPVSACFRMRHGFLSTAKEACNQGHRSVMMDGVGWRIWRGGFRGSYWLSSLVASSSVFGCGVSLMKGGEVHDSAGSSGGE